MAHEYENDTANRGTTMMPLTTKVNKIDVDEEYRVYNEIEQIKLIGGIASFQIWSKIIQEMNIDDIKVANRWNEYLEGLYDEE